MITRKLLAALVGLSLAAGTLGAATAQTSAPAVTQSASPADATVPGAAAKTDTMKKARVRHAHHARMVSKIHRKHVSLRGTRHVASKHVASKHVASKHVVSKRLGTKVAVKHAGKGVRVSHVTRRGLTKHV